MPLRLLGILVVVAAVLAAGCGGGDDDTSSTEAWAGDVCSAVTTWTGSISSAAQSLQGQGMTEESLKSTAGDVKSSTDDFVSTLKGLGKPDTDAGQQAKDSIDQLADELATTAQQVEDAVSNASGVSGILSAVSAVSGDLAKMGQQVAALVQNLEQLDPGSELQQAFQDADSCSDLQK
jgi:ABC-type transporter Mla subunit MlaD